MSPFSACTWAVAPISRITLRTSYIWKTENIQYNIPQMYSQVHIYYIVYAPDSLSIPNSAEWKGGREALRNVRCGLLDRYDPFSCLQVNFPICMVRCYWCGKEALFKSQVWVYLPRWRKKQQLHSPTSGVILRSSQCLFHAFIYWCLAWKKTPYIWLSQRACTQPSHCLGQEQCDFPLQQPVWEGSGWVTHNWRRLRHWSLIKTLTRVIRDNRHTPLPPTPFQMSPKHSSLPTTFRNTNCPSQQLNVPKRTHWNSKQEGNSLLSPSDSNAKARNPLLDQDQFRLLKGRNSYTEAPTALPCAQAQSSNL